MAVSGKTAAPIEAPYYLGTDKPPDMAEVTKAMSERTHALLNGLELARLAHGTAGQLIVVQDTGAAAYKVLSGDATISSSGALTIQNGAVTSKKIAGVRGRITSAGGIQQGTGFTCEKVGTGHYKIVFTTELASLPCTTVTPNSVTALLATASSSKTELNVFIWSTTGVATDEAFQFDAIPG